MQSKQMLQMSLKLAKLKPIYFSEVKKKGCDSELLQAGLFGSTECRKAKILLMRYGY